MTLLNDPKRWPKWLWRVWWFDRAIGDGRLLETGLISVKLTYGVQWLFFPAELFVFAFSDINAPRWVFSIPFFYAAIPSAIGLYLNMRGDHRSKWFRIFGATVGMSIWMFILMKNFQHGAFALAINPWMFMGIWGSLLIIRRAVLHEPDPPPELKTLNG